MSKLFAVLLIILGEFFAIGAEMIAAHKLAITGTATGKIFLSMFIAMTIAGGFLVLGYMLGYKAFQNIWIVSAVSITSIIIIEPILAYTIFHELPTRGAGIGLCLGIIGLITTLFIK